MTKIAEYQIKKNDFAETRLLERELIDLGEGEILVRIDRFALTANNVTYAVVGDKIRYWEFFPTGEEDWGIVPVWGFADVEKSNHSEIAEGERLYGYWPMASHLVMAPDKVRANRFVDGAPRRRDLPAVYNAYSRMTHEIGYDGDMDNERMTLYPLYATSFCIYDFLKDKDWFGADRVLVLSASSKTAIGLAYAIAGDDAPPRLSGMTSKGNVEAVRNLSIYDEVFTYDEAGSIPENIPTVIIDMSGDGGVLNTLHKRLGEAMRYTSNVGITHFEENKMGPDFIRDRSEMFFAPGHIAKRAQDWGPGEFEKRAGLFWHQAALKSRSWLTIQQASGAEAVDAAWREVLAGRVAPNAAWVVGM
ncbi:MAG: DUF2855 family protein [Pseudomonadota bacterium]